MDKGVFWRKVLFLEASQVIEGSTFRHGLTRDSKSKRTGVNCSLLA
jgi:hypothetical protein